MTRPISVEEKREFGKFLPNVRFQITPDSDTIHYRQFVDGLLREFIESDPKHRSAQFGLGDTPGSDGGISSIYSNDDFITHCKLLWFNNLHSIVFCNHHYLGAQAAFEVHKISDVFEQFLREKKIAYKRFARLKETNQEEILQSESPA